MKAFLSRFGSLVRFVLSGFDRLRFAGDSRLLNHPRGVQSYLHQRRILFKDYPAHAEQLTRRFRAGTRDALGDIPSSTSTTRMSIRKRQPSNWPNGTAAPRDASPC